MGRKDEERLAASRTTHLVRLVLHRDNPSQKWGLKLSPTNTVEAAVPRSPASVAGLLAADVVISVGSKGTITMDAASTEIRRCGATLHLGLEVRRRKEPGAPVAVSSQAAGERKQVEAGSSAESDVGRKRKADGTKPEPAMKAAAAKQPAAEPRVSSVLHRVEYELSGPYMRTDRRAIGLYSTKALAASNAELALDAYSPWGSDWRCDHMAPEVNRFASPPANGELYRFQSMGSDAETMKITIERIDFDEVDKPFAAPRGI